MVPALNRPSEQPPHVWDTLSVFMLKYLGPKVGAFGESEGWGLGFRSERFGSPSELVFKRISRSLHAERSSCAVWASRASDQKRVYMLASKSEPSGGKTFFGGGGKGGGVAQNLRCRIFSWDGSVCRIFSWDGSDPWDMPASLKMSRVQGFQGLGCIHNPKLTGSEQGIRKYNPYCSLL